MEATYDNLILFVFLFVFSCFGIDTFAQGNLSQTKQSKFSSLNDIGRQTLYGIELNFGDNIANQLIRPPEPVPPPTPDSGEEEQDKDTEREDETDSHDDDFFGGDDFFSDDLDFEEIKKGIEDDYRNTVAAWTDDYKQAIERWQKDRDAFLGKVEEYQSGTIQPQTLEALSSSDTPQFESTNLLTISQTSAFFNDMKVGNFEVVDGAFEIPIRNQSARGTCAAFAGIRAMELTLWQKGLYADLSEQFFYQISKPDCTPCSASGSHFIHGILATQKGIPVMEEQYCPYIPNAPKDNDTHYPLTNCKNRGLGAVVPSFVEVKVDSEWDIIHQLNQNRPVMIGVKLPPNFYIDNSLITLKESTQTGKVDQHASGHAMLLTGFVKLPTALEAEEGRYCAIAANSWGSGFGLHGYTCLTEKWLRKFALGKIWYSITDIKLTSF